MIQPDAGTILVVGGAGRTGRRVVTRLLDRDLVPRVLSRSPSGVPEGAEVVRGDLARLRDDAIRGVNGVVICVEPPYDATGASAVLDRGVGALAKSAVRVGAPVVLVSQIYITRPDAYPAMRDVILARGRGEEALRASGAPYVIVRPGWLHDRPPAGVRIEQGDAGDGPVSRDTVADACIAALLTTATHGRTFELYDGDPTCADPDWPALIAGLSPDEAPAAPPRR